LTTFWQTIDNFLTTFWQLFDNLFSTFLQLFDYCWKFFDNFLTPSLCDTALWHIWWFKRCTKAGLMFKLFPIFPLTSLSFATGLRTIQFLFFSNSMTVSTISHFCLMLVNGQMWVNKNGFLWEMQIKTIWKMIHPKDMHAVVIFWYSK
jgi:hypothetical protein